MKKKLLFDTIFKKLKIKGVLLLEMKKIIIYSIYCVGYPKPVEKVEVDVVSLDNKEKRLELLNKFNFNLKWYDYTDFLNMEVNEAKNYELVDCLGEPTGLETYDKLEILTIEEYEARNKGQIKELEDERLSIKLKIAKIIQQEKEA